MKCIKMLTFIPIEEIYEIEKWDDSRVNEKKELLAYELTKLVHGEEEAQKAQNAARAIFMGAGDDASMPSTEIIMTEDEIGLLDVMMQCKLIPSKGEGRRLVQQGGVTVNDEKVTDPAAKLTRSQLENGVKIKKGKKVFHKAVLAK